MDTVLTSVLLTISAVIAAAMIGSSSFPLLTRSTDAMTASSVAMETRIKTAVTVLHATADPAGAKLYLWVKNIGSMGIDGTAQSDLFLQTPGGSYDRISYGTGSGKWQVVLQDGATDWTPGVTAKITVSLATVPAGRYQVTLVTPAGISTQTTFSA